MFGRLKHTLNHIGGVYVKLHVPRSAAALSYNLTMSIFPFLICVSAILGSLKITDNSLFAIWEDIIPGEVLSVVSGYLKYVGGNISSLMIFVGIVAMVSTSSAVIRTIMSIFEEIQGKSRFTGIIGAVYSIAVSLVFLVVIYASGLIILSGEWLLTLLKQYFGFSDLLTVWQWVRFLLLFFLLLSIIFGIYKLTAPKEKKHVRRMPGASLASLLLVGVSMIFSKLISASVKYAVIYGSLASFIILMFWIYICSIILIMGNVFNVAVYNQEALREHKLF